MKRQQFLMAATSFVFLPSSPASAYSNPDYLDRLTSRLAHHQSQMGGAPLAREALRHARGVIPAAEGGGLALQASASRLCRLAALVLHDVRDLVRAEQLARTALRFGWAAGDPAAAERMLALAAITPLVDSPRLRIHQGHILHGTQKWASVPSVRDAREALRAEAPR